MLLPEEAFQFGANVGGWTPIWDATPSKSFASVNAGDPGLYVGGGGVNAAFGKSLKSASSYTTLHQAAINLGADCISEQCKIETTQFNEVQQPSQYCASIAKCFVRLVPELVTPQNYTTGAVIIDVFEPKSCPLHQNNKAMVYVVGPQGRNKTAGQFLSAVELTASNFILALNEYNSKQPRLDVVRMCLVSGGVFKHKSTSKDDVGVAIVQGIAKYWKPQISPLIEFAWDQDAFQHAMSKTL
eukprot:Gregarina_sp_Pseudo_9__1801@NODE_2223_length_1088_cov_16_958055_g2047_i0_p1_GENE_NODE_2223_length_1088_cov_16_958055_g2047_i0NODE_2223_length_1088_cov_16_958055_g2047_i0_p1_ORF_typecomplete_len242_score15_84GARS_N/PF02844_15/0_41GARS_N/PF02844_15/1_8e03_NODE_2223_length_1088_cov_16_958055_g2047_i03041029